MWPGNICDWGIKENPTEERPNTFVVYLPEGAKPGDVVEVTNEFGDKVVTRVPKVCVPVSCVGIYEMNIWLTNMPASPMISAQAPLYTKDQHKVPVFKELPIVGKRKVRTD